MEAKSRRPVDLFCLAFAIPVFTACLGDPGDAQLGQVEQAVAAVSVSHITWGVGGLDSNDVTKGPNVFPVGVRITNTGDVTATDVTSALAFTTANANVTIDAPSSLTFATLAPGARAA